MLAIILQGEDGTSASIVAENVQVSGNRLEIEGDPARYLEYSRKRWTASPKVRKVVGAQRWLGYTISSPGSLSSQ